RKVGLADVADQALDRFVDGFGKIPLLVGDRSKLRKRKNETVIDLRFLGSIHRKRVAIRKDHVHVAAAPRNFTAEKRDTLELSVNRCPFMSDIHKQDGAFEYRRRDWNLVQKGPVGGRLGRQDVRIDSRGNRHPQVILDRRAKRGGDMNLGLATDASENDEVR